MADNTGESSHIQTHVLAHSSDNTNNIQRQDVPASQISHLESASRLTSPKMTAVVSSVNSSSEHDRDEQHQSSCQQHHSHLMQTKCDRTHPNPSTKQQDNGSQAPEKRPSRHRKRLQSQSEICLAEQEHILTATDCKNIGNKLCSLLRYEEAICFYSKAIIKGDGVPIYYSNRALCHLKLQQWSQVVQDCRRALELDQNLIKAHFYLGQALSELQQFGEALKHLQRAHELAKENKLNFGDDITQYIRLTKKKNWNQIEDQAIKLEDELKAYLVDLIRKDCEDKIRRINSSSIAWPQEVVKKSTITETQIQDADKNTPEIGSVDQSIDLDDAKIQTQCDIYIEKVESMFNNLKLDRKRREVPDHLCGKISFEILHDPVITPSGITYDRQDVEEHLRRVGHFDPITRQPLTANQLIPNLAMKEVVDAYLNDNEWAKYQ